MPLSLFSDKGKSMAKTKWISTKESVPKSKQPVLIKYRRWNGKEETAEAWFDGIYIFNFVDSTRFERLQNVTHWKPIEE